MPASPPEVDPTTVPVLRHPRWSHLQWLAHGFSARKGGLTTVYNAVYNNDESAEFTGELNLGFTPADERELVLRNRELWLQALTGGESGARLQTLSQIHSSIVHGVSDPDEVPAGDGMVTASPGLYLAIQTADCVPVLLVDEKQRVVAAVHAGWKGTVKRIVEVAVDKMRQQFGSDPGDLSALIGPSIGPCCYVVGGDLQQEFTAAFSYAEQLFHSRNNGGETRLHLDLGKANQRQLIESGVHAGSIDQLGGCTACQPDKYFSHRRSQGHTGRMMSSVGIRAQ